MRARAAAPWPTVHDERRRLVADLSELRDDQWRLPSLCSGWDLHDVLAHLVDSARTGRVSFVRGLLMARLDFDRANEKGIARHKRHHPQDTLEALRAATELTRTPPAPLATRLVEAIVHGEDIRRPVGIAGRYPEPAIERPSPTSCAPPSPSAAGASAPRACDSSTGGPGRPGGMVTT